ncbi:hypothetical protein K2173_021981 [Erythroxylum novogranatense]|uniref:Uncharacterized protein n=1 Tax=Erythroxylum novogranatense TaxID=1862640 RepID=A0AAV8T403_9ROSI|nr:hypothetical protein K2173_021981 [Erythroxylum novogranatense]
MGTKVHCDSYLQGHFSMKDLTEDSNSCNWHLYYGDKSFVNGQCYNGFLPRAVTDTYPGYDKDVLKRTMLEHEATFKNQLCELHRLYKIQRDLMAEAKRKELPRNCIHFEGPLSSPLVSQITCEDGRKWHIPSFPLGNSVGARKSTSGIDDIHSPLSSMKGSSIQISPWPSQNGGSPKDVEILEIRPTKARKKMFDLQLPADEYIDKDEREQLRDDNLSGISSYLSNKYHRIASESGKDLFPGDGVKNGFQGDNFQSKSFLRNKSNVADLNEPVEVEGTHASPYVNLLISTSSRGELQRHEEAAKLESQSVGISKDMLLGARHGCEHGTFSSSISQNDPNEKCWFTHMFGADNGKSSLKSASQSLEHEKLGASSHPVQFLFNKTQEQSKFFQADDSKVDKWRERLVNGSELSERNREKSNTNFSESFITSHLHSSCRTASLNLGKSWSHSVFPWDRPSGSINQVRTHRHLNTSATLSGSPSSSHSQGIFAERWNHSSNAACIPSFQNEMPKQNGLYHGSSSWSKELPSCPPSCNYDDYLHCRAANNLASEQFINHSSAKFYSSSNCKNLKSVKDVNLNVIPSNSSSNRPNPQYNHELIDIERIPDDNPETLPWLRANSACRNEVTDARLDVETRRTSSLQSAVDQLLPANETRKGPNHIILQNLKSASCSNVAKMSNSPGCQKLLGFPIFEKSTASKNESFSLTSSSVSHPQPLEGEIENKRKLTVLDINLPCDPAVPQLGQQAAAEGLLPERESDAKLGNLRHEIDLNSCMSDEEASLIPSVPGSNAKIVSGIDLEAPAVHDTEEDVNFGEECLENVQGTSSQLNQYTAASPLDELVRVAVEAIVAISFSSYCNGFNDTTVTPSEASMTDPDTLEWFAEIALSCGDDLKSKIHATLRAKDGGDNERSSPEAIDYFESMTLNLIETTEEDYTPKPLVPENLNLKETGTTTPPTRNRKGQARRGRQRRDFQRDILPSLASLSRHEVTEDIQIFGWLMKATGHQWHSGLMRRNSTRGGGARGRRRLMTCPTPAVTAIQPCTPLIQQLNNIEVGLEDRRLTGWGKTTRRPRRQRCPAGNLPVVTLT